MEYSFKHALTTEVAYGALLRERQDIIFTDISLRLSKMSAQNISHDHLKHSLHHAFHGETLG